MVILLLDLKLLQLLLLSVIQLLLSVRLPIVEEREPNNWPEFAMKIRAGTAVRGRIGYPLTPKMGDRDVYCFVVAGTGRQTLRVDLTGVPKLKLQLEVRTHKWGTVHTA